MSKVLIAGGSGLVGKHLTKKFLAKGYKVAILSRTKQNKETYIWDISKQYIEPKALEKTDYIINLSGAGIADKRWSKQRKQAILNSRVQSGELLFKSFKDCDCKPRAFITASAIGYYGAVTSNGVFDEHTPAAQDFLGQTCKQWEAITEQFETIGVRSVAIRTGVVLSTEGGALPKMALPIKLGVGSALGSGKQYMPWIHLDDLCNIYIHAIEHETLKGAYNAVAPEHTTNKQLTQEIARILNRPLWLPNVPAWVMELLYGKMAQILLQGSKVSAEKVCASGYHFSFYSLSKALKSLYCKI